jgi:hypothetical protein
VVHELRSGDALMNGQRGVALIDWPWQWPSRFMRMGRTGIEGQVSRRTGANGGRSAASPAPPTAADAAGADA